MNQNKWFISIWMHSKWNMQYRTNAPLNAVRNCMVNSSSYKFYTDKTPKDPSKAKEEKIESVKMPGFVHPDSINEEGYFTQRAKQQLEELKKRVDKPTVENTERKD